MPMTFPWIVILGTPEPVSPMDNGHPEAICYGCIQTFPKNRSAAANLDVFSSVAPVDGKAFLQISSAGFMTRVFLANLFLILIFLPKPIVA